MNSLKPYENTGVIPAAKAMALVNALPDPEEPNNSQSEPSTNPIVLIDGFIRLENISCTDADGRVFEHYDSLLVRKDIFRSEKNQISRTPYHHAIYCEENGLFLPSFALTCNILTKLFEQRSNVDSEKVLLQYKDKGNGNGWHVQNTIINYGTSEIVHYPSASDFEQQNLVNTSRRIVLHFVKDSLEDALLNNALKDPSAKRYVQQLTGLQHPEILVDIGKYFGKPAQLWFPWIGKAGNNYTQKETAWFGCDSIKCILDSNGNLYHGNAARGVKL